MPRNNLRLLALDGGGVRGLSALLILERLMKTVDSETPPKPCDYFDMIGGTSTGGLIAVMLGRLRMSVKDCIAAYLSLSERVFCKPRSMLIILGRVRSRFDSEELARAVKKVISAQGLAEDSLLKDSDAACKVFVCATAMETGGTVCFTSYPTPGGNDDLLECTKIWEACLATSAAPSFFDPVVIGPYGEKYLDGAMGANNPVRKVWDQAQLMWGAGPQGGRVKCLVSIGTGMPSLKSFDGNVYHIGKTILAMATETQQTAEDFGREYQSLEATQWYYRFNVLRGLEDIGLEEAAKVNMMAAATRKYLYSEEVQRQIQACMQTSPLQVIADSQWVNVKCDDFSDLAPKGHYDDFATHMSLQNPGYPQNLHGGLCDNICEETKTLMGYTIRAGLVIWEHDKYLTSHDGAWNSLWGFCSEEEIPRSGDFRITLQLGHVITRTNYQGVLQGGGLLIKTETGTLIGFVFTGQSKEAYVVEVSNQRVTERADSRYQVLGQVPSVQEDSRWKEERDMTRLGCTFVCSRVNGTLKWSISNGESEVLIETISTVPELSGNILDVGLCFFGRGCMAVTGLKVDTRESRSAEKSEMLGNNHRSTLSTAQGGDLGLVQPPVIQDTLETELEQEKRTLGSRVKTQVKRFYSSGIA